MLGWWSSKCAIRTPPSHSGIPLLIGHWFWMNHLFLRSAINQWFESWYLILGLIFDPSANRVLAIVYRVFFVVFADEIWSTISWDPWWLKQMSQRLRHRGVVSKPSLKMVCWYATTWSSILLEKMAAGLFGRLSEPEITHWRVWFPYFHNVSRIVFLPFLVSKKGQIPASRSCEFESVTPWLYPQPWRFDMRRYAWIFLAVLSNGKLGNMLRDLAWFYQEKSKKTIGILSDRVNTGELLSTNGIVL
jgi:hypothetical protein